MEVEVRSSKVGWGDILVESGGIEIALVSGLLGDHSRFDIDTSY
jgi:hypothetical protein